MDDFSGIEYFEADFPEVESDIQGDHAQVDIEDWQEPPDEVFVGSKDSFHLRIGTVPFIIELFDNGTLKARTTAPPFFTGTVAEKNLMPDSYHDPYDPFFPVTWIGLERIVKYRFMDNQHQFILKSADGKKSALLLVSETEEGRFLLGLQLDNPSDDVNLRIALEAPEGENYYGLGEIFESVAQRGYRRAMQFELTSLESANNEAHFPIPFFTSTNSWGLFVESRLPGSFDMAYSVKDELLVDFEATSLLFYIFAGKKPMDILKHYVEITGKPAIPAPWAFAPMFWRNQNKDQNEVIEDALAIRANDIPASTIWVDNPWQTAYNSFLFDQTKFPDPVGMIKRLNDLGFRVGVWSTPYISKEMGEIYEKALENNYFVKVPGGAWFEKFGKLVDLTNPGAVEMWKVLIDRASSIGIEGFKLDYGEDVQVGILGKVFEFGFYNGGNSKNMHHWYNYFYHKPYFDKIGDEKGWLLNRGGTYGDQTVTPIVWPGDLCQGFQVFGEDDKHVGGLPSAINGGLSLSVSGYPFFGADTGGYRHRRPSKHEMIRWSQYTALGTIMQVGGGGDGGGNHNPWDFESYEEGKSQFDQELLDIFRVFAKIQISLFPYKYTYARLAKETGRCVTCPFGFVYPELGVHPDHQFMLGDYILVAPVADDGFKKEVHFPQGRWFDFFTDDYVDGQTAITMDVAIGDMPIYISEGAIIPMLSGEVDTLAPVVEAGINSFVSTPQDLIVRIYPSKYSEFKMYDGTVITFQNIAPHLQIEYKGSYKALLFEIHLKNNKAEIAKPAAVKYKGTEIAEKTSIEDVKTCDKCFFYSLNDEILFIKLPAASGGVGLLSK